MISPSDRCDLRGVECACDPTHCAVQPQTTPAPVPRFTVRDQLIIISFGFAMMAIGYLALSEADRQFKAQDLRNQEQVTTWKR